jgi:hypothetical protein
VLHSQSIHGPIKIVGEAEYLLDRYGLGTGLEIGVSEIVQRRRGQLSATSVREEQEGEREEGDEGRDAKREKATYTSTGSFPRAFSFSLSLAISFLICSLNLCNLNPRTVSSSFLYNFSGKIISSKKFKINGPKNCKKKILP